MSTHIAGFAELPQMLTVDQLVQLLQLPSKETVYYWNRTGSGPTYCRVGKYVRYNKSDVLNWLEDRDSRSW
jgi:predicted DNA-binding transcriptional regulator AlpA